MDEFSSTWIRNYRDEEARKERLEQRRAAKAGKAAPTGRAPMEL